jgi:phage tail sheath protein FI
MPPVYTYPGVYITEQPSGAQAVTAAATSIALFVGMVDQGPFQVPTRIQSWQDFVRNFGATSKGEMADQVAQFFFNGGGDSYVMRIAAGAAWAAIDLQNEAATAVLTLTARDAGALGNTIQAAVDYATASPERTFNLTAWRSVLNADGTYSQTNSETYKGLSMDPGDPRFVETVVNAQSLLIRAKSKAPAPAGASVGGASISGMVFASGTPDAGLTAALSGSANAAFTISINRLPSVPVTFSTGGTIINDMKAAIIAAYQGQGVDMSATLNVQWQTFGPGKVIEIASTLGPVVVTPASTLDCAVTLQLGVLSGGVEVDDYSPLRPAPSGVFANVGSMTGTPSAAWLGNLSELATQTRNNVVFVGVTDPIAAATLAATQITYSRGAASDALTVVAGPPASNSLANLASALDDIASAINGGVALLDLANQRWTAVRQGWRLVLQTKPTLGALASLNVAPKSGKTGVPPAQPSGGYNFAAAGKYWAPNGGGTLAAYTLGVPQSSGLQGGQKGGFDGTEPMLGDYTTAFGIVDSSVEIFNMLVLPRTDAGNDDRRKIWGAASAFATKSRAILLVDPDSTWTSIGAAVTGADAIKVGLDTPNSVIYWPALQIPTSTGGVKQVDPSGSMAGLYARTDQAVGTWKAAAGLEATLANALGLTVTMSDDQNGLINPKAMNAIRLFPTGITSWGARTLAGSDDSGDIDDKYINVRRMMLFIENSLYRGLRFATFKNNAEPLWASIRLAAGSFMNGLMVQGAFASTTKSQAYYVLCDSTTTSATDINLGIVNVLVGFAPNKPAEFVHLTVTQMAGQTQA